MSAARPATAQRAVPASSFMLIGILALLWGCNWPVLKVGVTELAPLTFRAASLPFAGIGLFFGGWWVLSAKNWFKGPVRMGTEAELERIEGGMLPAET